MCRVADCADGVGAWGCAGEKCGGDLTFRFKVLSMERQKAVKTIECTVSGEVSGFWRVDSLWTGDGLPRRWMPRGGERLVVAHSQEGTR